MKEILTPIEMKEKMYKEIHSNPPYPVLKLQK